MSTLRVKNKTIIPPAHRISDVKEYYFSTKLKEIKKLNDNGASVLNLGIGNPDLPPPQSVLDRLHIESQNVNNHGYQSYVGIEELRNEYAQWYKSNFSVQLKPESEVLPLIGSKEGIMHISMAFLNAGDEVLIPNPGYPTYSSVSKLVGADVKYYSLSEQNDWQPDFEELDQLVSSKTKIMWINYPHMPTGALGSYALFEKLITFALKHSILLVNDNPYSFILNNKPMSIMSLPRAKEVALELNSLSKTYNMAGWRIGSLVGDSEYINAVLRVKSNMDSGMFKPLQLGAVQALRQDENWTNKMNAVYSKRKELAYTIFDILNVSYAKDQVGMFLWGKLPEKQGSEGFVEGLLQEKKVFITPGFIFGSQGENYVRISLCSSENVLKEVIERIV